MKVCPATRGFSQEPCGGGGVQRSSGMPGGTTVEGSSQGEKDRWQD